MSTARTIPSDAADVVVVGAGLAGLRTVERLRRLGYSGRLTLVGSEALAPYDRPPLSKQLLVAPERPSAPVHLRPQARMGALDLDLRLGVPARAVDLKQRRLSLDDGSELSWDRLVVATGVRPRTLPDWDETPSVTVLRTFDDCLRLRDALRAGTRIVVVGAGVLGCEVAASARSLGIEVDLVEPLAQPLLRAVGPRLGAFVAEQHRRHGVTLHLDTSVHALLGARGDLHVELTDGATLPAHHVLVAVGSRPNTEWLEGSGLALDDGVVCDATGAATSEGVFAVGDVARMPRGLRETSRVEHWTNATDTAHHVAHNLLVAPEARLPFTNTPYFWSDQYGWKLQVIGLPHQDDDLCLVDGQMQGRAGRLGFLALHVRKGMVTAVSGVDRSAALARCRALLETQVTADEALVSAPWVPAAAR